MVGRFGPGGASVTGAYGPVHDAIAGALGISNQELWNARAAGKTVAELAAEKNVPLQSVVDAATNAYAAQLDAAVKAGSLTQGQADALQQLTRDRIQTQLQSNTALGAVGPGMAGRGMMRGFGFGFGSGRQSAP